MKNTTGPEIAPPALVIEKEGCPICAVIEDQKQILCNFEEPLHGLVSKRYFNAAPLERTSVDELANMVTAKRGLAHNEK